MVPDVQGYERERVNITWSNQTPKLPHERIRGMVRMIAITPVEFDTYRQRSIEGYAKEQIKAGNWEPSQARERAEKEFIRLLPISWHHPDIIFCQSRTTRPAKKSDWPGSG
jgi:hypothetical protein